MHINNNRRGIMIKRFTTLIAVTILLAVSFQTFAESDSSSDDNNISRDHNRRPGHGPSRPVIRPRPRPVPYPVPRPRPVPYPRPRPYPIPRPRPIMVNLSCEVGLFDRGYQMERFLGHASGYNYNTVKDRACDNAMRKCRDHRRYGERCEIIW
jgi:hypothetical protein